MSAITLYVGIVNYLWNENKQFGMMVLVVLVLGDTFWGLIIGFIIWLIVRSNKWNDSDLKTSALNITKERYTKAEISNE